jgi:hypothetical protein
MVRGRATGTLLALVAMIGVAQLGNGRAASAEDAKTGPASDRTNRAAIQKWLDSVSKTVHPPIPPKVVQVDGVNDQVFPADRFYAIRYTRFPRAVKPPDSLGLENLVRVRPDGSVERIESLQALKALFQSKVADVRTESQARALLVSLLRLSEEFYQDGNFSFEIPQSSLSVVRQKNGIVASGKAVVAKGGEGEISVAFRTDAPTKIEIAGKVRSDVRLR